MALKRQYQVSAAFSMASMTDVIFLLLIFFMVTSTFVLPNALEVELPESSEDTPLQPSAALYIDSEGRLYVTSFPAQDGVPQEVTEEELGSLLRTATEASDSTATADYVALYADEAVTYGTIVRALDAGAGAGVRMVLATVPAPSTVLPAQTGVAEAPLAP